MSIEALKSFCDWAAVVLILLTFLVGTGALITGNILNDRQAEQLRKFDESMTKAKIELANAQLSLARYTAPVYLVPLKNGVAIPDLSKGFNQRVVLTADTRISEPLFPQLTGHDSIMWTLFLDQDAHGSHAYVIDSAPDLILLHGLLPNTRATFEFVTE